MKYKGRIKLTCDVERGAQKGIDWITFFSGKEGDEYNVMYTDPRGVWVKAKSSQVPVLLVPDEYVIVDGAESGVKPHLRLI